jgi:hypothetical protein
LNSLCARRARAHALHVAGRITEPLPIESGARGAFEHVADDLHVAVPVRPESHARLDAVLVDHAQRPKPMCSGSWYSAKEKLWNESSHPCCAWPRSRQV